MEHIIKKSVLFQGFWDAEIEKCLKTLHASEKTYLKDELILQAGTRVESIGLVMDGSVTIEAVDSLGNRSIMGHVSKGEIFAEVFALCADEILSVDVRADEDCRILFLNIQYFLNIFSGKQSWESKLIMNLLQITSNKNLNLTRKCFDIAPKSVRRRIMSYLEYNSLQKNTKSFAIPFDRQEMADYLNVERTALCRELSRMQQEGLICYRKNQFEILI